MGTLHDAVIEKEQQQRLSAGSSKTFSDRDAGQRLTSNQSSTMRFVPRTTHLEDRKRKMNDVVENSQTDDSSSEPLIGPKLPEPPKMDMEDESLNTTVSLIRSTMKQVGTIPDLKPVQKKVKPRRRI